jgi:hypothetical protein
MDYRDLMACMLALGMVEPLPIPLKNASAGQQSQAAGEKTAVTTVSGPTHREDASGALKDGTAVKLRFTEDVVSSKVLAGDIVELQVVKEVKSGGVTVIAKDDLARATVILAQAKRRMARDGNLVLRVEAVRLVDGRTAPLRAVKEVKGTGASGAVAGAVVVVGMFVGTPAVLLTYVKGDDVVIEKGTEMTAFVDGDVKVDTAKLPANRAPEAPAQKER